MTVPLPPVPEGRWGGCVLAGGQSSRMAGRDKGLLAIEGKPVAGWVLERLMPQVQEIVISANRHLDDYQALGVPVVPDLLTGSMGPLAGIHAALTFLGARCEAVVFVPCDGPLLPVDLVIRLGAALARKRAAYVTVQGRAQPTFSIVRSEEHLHLAQYLLSGGRRLLDYFESLDAVAVSFDDVPECFTNLNTPKEWASFKASGGRRT